MPISLCFYGKARVGDACVALARSLGISIEQKDDADELFDSRAFWAVIPTPGVPPRNRAYSGGNILSELDFAHRYLPAGFSIITVTGTDGKSTTAWILYEIFRREYGNDRTFLSGNFDIPFSETVRIIREKGLTSGIIVVEASSFMLHNVGSAASISLLSSLPIGEREGGFLSDHSVFTNLESDHLNWHSDLAEYFWDKLRMVECTRQTAAINTQVRDRASAWGLSIPNLPQIRFFGTDPVLKDWTDGERIGNISGLCLSETRFSGMHNALNILSCTVITNALKIDWDRIRTYLKEIGGLPHRLEFVTEKNGVRYVDDSKSTSCQSLKAALSAFPEKSVRLIAGGSDKGDPFEGLSLSLEGPVVFAALIGATAPKLAEICTSIHLPHRICTSMEEAVLACSQNAKMGDTVLLSPGCASFGMFRDYLDRAEKFREAVERQK